MKVYKVAIHSIKTYYLKRGSIFFSFLYSTLGIPIQWLLLWELFCNENINPHNRSAFLQTMLKGGMFPVPPMAIICVTHSYAVVNATLNGLRMEKAPQAEDPWCSRGLPGSLFCPSGILFSLS